MTIKAIVFDMDDTLYEEQDYVVSGFKAVDEYVSRWLGIDGFYDIAVEMFRSDNKQMIFNRTLDRLEVEYDDRLIADLVDHYRCHYPDIRLLDDARWVLEQLHDDVKIALISDGYLSAQRQKVAALNLSRRFDYILLTDELGRENWKPNPLPYQTVSRKLHIPHHECMYIGDNVMKDFISANKLGWTTVHVSRKDGVYRDRIFDSEYQAHYRVDSLRTLENYSVFQHLFKKGDEHAS